MSKNNRNIIFTVVLCIVLLGVFWIDKNEKVSNVEEQDIHIGSGHSLKNNGDKDVSYDVPFSVYIFNEDGTIESTVFTGIEKTIGETRSNRQSRCSKKISFGFEKVLLLDEEYAKYGIGSLLNILFKNSMARYDGTFIVCKGKSTNYLKEKIVGYNSSSDYMAEMIKHQQGVNFLGKNYSINDLFLIVDSEGRNAVLPYIEKNKNTIELKGMAVFKKDKLVNIINIHDAKIMNMLREKSVNGILSIEKNTSEYINVFAVIKKKVKCEKSADKYKFIIDLKVKGDVMSNILYTGMLKDEKVVKIFENDMEEKLQKDAYSFLKKMKTSYRIDCLELGRIAASKYGRGTGVDWNEIVCNSDIQVNVEVKLDKVGRGDY